jgi:hypothetical protein
MGEFYVVAEVVSRTVATLAARARSGGQVMWNLW